MSEHTPGPWTLSRNLGPWTSSAGHVHHTIERGSHGCINVEQSAGDEAEANARLIVAAPEMLEALRTIVDRSVLGAPGNPFGEQARAAIAKATGAGGATTDTEAPRLGRPD